MKTRSRTNIRWAGKWIDKDGSHIIYDNCLPKLFRTRAEARSWLNGRYGYIKERKDLRLEPHCWRMPQPVRVKVVEA